MTLPPIIRRKDSMNTDNMPQGDDDVCWFCGAKVKDCTHL